MINKILLALTIVFAIACSKDNADDSIKQENGNIWMSGGLYFCAQQVRLDNGDTLVVTTEDVIDIISLKSGNRVNVKYKEIGKNENCSNYFDCEVIEIKLIE